MPGGMGGQAKGQGNGKRTGPFLETSNAGVVEEKHTRENQHQNSPISPRKQMGGKGKGAQGAMMAPTPVLECQKCKEAGKDFNHKWEECREGDQGRRLQQ